MKKLLLIIVSICLFSPSVSFAQSAKDALKALKRLEARCESGISYKEYSPALGDAQFEVNLYLESKEAKDNPKLAMIINGIMFDYKWAKLAWDEKFSKKPLMNSIMIDSSLAQSLIKIYPDMKKPFTEGGAYSVSTIFFMKHEKLMIPGILNVIWGKASNSIKEATTMLAEKQIIPDPGKDSAATLSSDKTLPKAESETNPIKK